MNKPDYDSSATFTSSNVGMEAKVPYIAVIVGSSTNALASESNPDKMNLVLATVKRSVLEEKGKDNIVKEDWINRTASSRALVEAGIVSDSQKARAMREGSLFEVSFKYTDRVIGQDANGADIHAKRYDAKQINEEDL